MDCGTAWQILLLIVLLLVVIWVYYSPKKMETLMDNRIKVINDELRWLYIAINDILNTASITIEYELYQTDHVTCSAIINNKIHIGCVLWNDNYDRIYNYNTAIYAILSEIALNLTQIYGKSLESYKHLLLNTATKLHYYDTEIGLETGYPML